MYLTHLSLVNFRNYVRLSLDMPRKTIVLQGSNAQGKTNLLEAIYYLAAAQSPYATTGTQLVNWLAAQDDLPHARIVAEVAHGQARTRIEITLTQYDNGRPGYRQHIRVNGVAKRRMDLLGHANVVLFVPQDIALVDGPPAGRRRYLDSMLCQIDVQYCHWLTRFSRVLEQRNHLLRTLRDRGGPRDQLDFWDEELVRNGANIIARRQQAIVELEALAQPIHRDLSGGLERLRLRYLPSFEPGDAGKADRQLRLDLDLPPPVSRPGDVDTIGGVYQRFLRKLQQTEIQRGLTTVGPHRDDIRLFDGQVDLHLYGSRGQQRTAVLALKLAEVALMTEVTGEQPILLLDEVMSELDSSRRRYLCDRLDRVEQALVTTTDLNALTPDVLTKSTLYRVSEGRLEGLEPQPGARWANVLSPPESIDSPRTSERP